MKSLQQYQFYKRFVEVDKKTTGKTIVPILLALVFMSVSIITAQQYQRIFLIVELVLVCVEFLFVFNKLPYKYNYVYVGIIYCIFATLVNGSGLGTLIQFVMLALILILSRETVLTSNQAKLLDVTYLFLLFFILVFYGKNTDYGFESILTGKTINPNGYASVITCFAMMLHTIISKISIKKTSIKLIAQALIILVIAVVLNITRSRNQMLFYGIFVLLMIGDLIYKHFRESYPDKFYSKLVLCSILISFIMVCFYLALSDIMDGEPIKFLGKDLFNGRDVIWQQAINYYVSSANTVFAGISNKIVYTGNFVNIHNGYLTLLCNLSFVGLIVFVYLYVANNKTYQDQVLCDYKVFALVVFALIATFENLLVDNSYCLLMVPFIFNKTRRSNDRQSN